MPYSVEYDPLGIISIKVQGELTMTMVREFTVEAAHLAKEKDCFRVLTDLQEAPLKLSMVEVYNLPNLTAEIASTAGLQVYQFKRALVVLNDEKLAPFVVTCELYAVPSDTHLIWIGKSANEVWQKRLSFLQL